MESNQSELGAYGALIALIPEVADLVKYRKGLPADTPPEEVRELILARIHEKVLGGIGQPLSLLDSNVWDLVEATLLPSLRAQLGDVTVRQALSFLSEWLGADSVIADYIESAAAGNAEFPTAIKGGVVTVPSVELGGFKTAPVVILAVSPVSSLDELITELRDTCHVAFRDVPKHKVDTYIELARIGELIKQGMNRWEITWQLLADRYPEIAVATDEERERDYKVEYTRERTRLRKTFHRLGLEP